MSITKINLTDVLSDMNDSVAALRFIADSLDCFAKLGLSPNARDLGNAIFAVLEKQTTAQAEAQKILQELH